MAKETKSVLVDDLNAEGAAEEGLNVDDLNAGGIVQDNQQHDETDGGSADDADGAEDETAAPEYVVLKGNCIRHDGEVYRENLRIPVSGKDAERLLDAGVIADVQVLRQRALSAARGVKITTE
ncbi:hypothetical protein OW946_21830 [Klebsiella pneumoniae]|uniref:hypothetical protein n=1 Tax=Klebsiella/Raoultella group TaxID=2890311 RepID=UPI0015E91AA1|nr:MULTISPECIES: hypothetical protein [Klebsiella/Raoultella group]MBF8461190.1 hypothetical protein [Klebsiella michiganensis]QLT89256.1 hypothetical protein HV252_18745 [Klebsiella grimontii]QQO49544.1 hypothetical protein HQH16_14880 [Raoultella ornithinolytica]HBM2965598.1 hypothetical protein [Klebsiella michiganensis]